MKRDYRVGLTQLIAIVVLAGGTFTGGCSRKVENAAEDTIIKSYMREEKEQKETESTQAGSEETGYNRSEQCSAVLYEEEEQTQQSGVVPSVAEILKQEQIEQPAAEPSEPEQPEQSAAEPSEPERPEQPQQPSKEPVEPEQPEQPEAEPLEPEQPAAEPSTPEQPEQPELPTAESIQSEPEEKEKAESHVHDLITQWYGAPPDCSHGGYQMVWCSQCGWVDEAACKSVPPLEHTPIGEEIQHGNCKEDTIVVYTCSQCGEQTGFERYTEPDEHNWVTKEMEVWDEENLAFIIQPFECCEWCNARP
ncbi:MAG: hypothetical protein IJZ34_11530 [Lachnospiraceae bacterium]|nr:hypothetical protein [Lachnospiraceae bacterium]